MVIVTSRELGVLRSWGLSSRIYEMPRLEISLARQLFCWHAFLQLSPLPEFKDLVEDFLKACNGLPLSFKLLGAHLYGRSCKDYWKSQLDEFRKTLHEDIKTRLRISYDALNEKEKDMFLDVACFLIGVTERTAIAVWDGMDLNGLHGLHTLVNKSLVELVHADRWKNVFKEERIRMHDQLRDMGREIASSDSSSYRLWGPGQIRDMKKHFKRFFIQKDKPIRGIGPPATFKAFKEYKQQLVGISNGLQLLHVEGNEFTEEFASLSEDIVWLRWDRFPLKNLPPWLTLRQLSVSELYVDHGLKDL